MRCDCCPLCPSAEDDVCTESEGKYGIEHADGMSGCKHPYSWVKKRDEEYTEHLGDMATDIGIEMALSKDQIKRVIEICKHMIGLDYKKPYHRHGKAFYKPYRNFYAAPLTGEPNLDRLPYHIVSKKNGDLSVLYELTKSGLDWLGRQIHITIKE